MHRVCVNDRDTYLRIEVWNNEANGQHLLLGQAETSVAGILSHPFAASSTAADSGAGAGGGRAAEHGIVHVAVGIAGMVAMIDSTQPLLGRRPGHTTTCSQDSGVYNVEVRVAVSKKVQ